LARGARLRILEAAIRSFADVGYEGTTTACVARDAGVTQPLVHHHFGSKEGLWRAAMDHLFAGVNDFVPAANDPNPLLALTGVLEQFVRYVAVRPEVTRVITREGAVASPRLSLLVDLYLRAPFQRVIDLVRAGQAGGAIRSDVRPELFLFFMLGAGSHLFDVAALARVSAAVDVDAEAVREEFVALARSVLIDGLLRRR
jgi:AcrR family transcriptional regulator